MQLALNHSESHIETITNIFMKEGFPIPDGFSDNDIDLSAPPLYYDVYALSFVYGMSKIGLKAYGTITSTIARNDILEFFSVCLTRTNELFKKSINLMLSKGIYDRPPKIPYPKKVEFVENQSFMTGWFGERRPLNTIELTNIFFNIERNYFAILLLTGFTQVVKDKEIREFFKRGKDISEKQISIFNKILREEDLLGTVPVTLDVTESTTSPFSDKLMLFIITSLNSSGIGYVGDALGVSMRRDLGTHYSRLIIELMKFSEDGANLMINRRWMEQPPQAPNRKTLVQS